ncbi:MULTISPECIES: DUF86 domain-containing protein [Cyanophyceae]|uniref:DUF86 domain-containing protein n=1 Tax=Stenomitos frigidus AS-A4 TaxID=2933935 RepID=A0ABV0KT46_9CYAN|nr:DUF86 domain-containing protein [Phormidium sp. FACHB-592]
MSSTSHTFTNSFLDIDLDIVWNVVEHYLPKLKQAIEVIFQQV